MTFPQLQHWSVGGIEELTYQEGRTSLSDAMATKLLLASLEQNLIPVPTVVPLFAIRVDARLPLVLDLAGTRALAFTKLVELVQVDRKQGVGLVKICGFQRAGREQRLERLRKVASLMEGSRIGCGTKSGIMY